MRFFCEFFCFTDFDIKLILNIYSDYTSKLFYTVAPASNMRRARRLFLPAKNRKNSSLNSIHRLIILVLGAAGYIILKLLKYGCIVFCRRIVIGRLILYSLAMAAVLLLLKATRKFLCEAKNI